MKLQKPDESECDYLDRCAAELADAHALTLREHQILRAVLDGMTRKAIAARFAVQVTTVKWHLHTVYSKTSTASTVELFQRALGLSLWREHQGDFA